MLDTSDDIGREVLAALGNAGNYRVVTTFTNYDTMHAALRARADELQVTRATLDHVCGLKSGHSSKLLGPGKTRWFGAISLGLMLQAFGLVGVLVEDRRLLRKMAPPLRTIPRTPRAAKRRKIARRENRPAAGRAP